MRSKGRGGFLLTRQVKPQPSPTRTNVNRESVDSSDDRAPDFSHLGCLCWSLQRCLAHREKMLAQGGSLQVTNCVPKNCDTACHWRGCYTRQHYPSINQLRTLGILQLTTLSTTPWPLASQLCQNSPQLYSL